ncbi:excinuclease ABC subunit UvrC [Candidatus Peregrinibacteria bacterium]|nr:excinuclease ABC subunit UvrC [Candidatus Peregrinibacteria bacterium]
MNATKKNLIYIIGNTPHKPGVYRFLNGDKKIIYVGKAKDLKKRLSSYFQKTKKDEKTKQLVSHIDDIEYTVVDTELEAIMLETNMIKEHRPKYNILMKDDKNYVYIKITKNEDFPKIFITREVKNDKALYFGPKTARYKVEKTLKVLKKIFPYRHCFLEIIELPDSPGKTNVKVTKATIKYPCIDYHIKRCDAPCIGNISKDDYNKIITYIIDFLNGNHEQIIDQIKNQIAKSVAEKKFEKAAQLRDRLLAIQDIMETQSVTAPDHQNTDVINYIFDDEKAYFNLFQLREGKLLNQENFELFKDASKKTSSTETLRAFVEQYYLKTTDIPNTILVPHRFDDIDSMQALISDLKGRKVIIKEPKKGRNDKLLELAHKNAAHFSKLNQAKWQSDMQNRRKNAFKKLSELLDTNNQIKRIECFDISHLGGTETVSSMVVFENGFPKKSDYRKFKLSQNNAGKPDDFASIEEALTRRIKYLKPSLELKEIKITKPTKKDLSNIKEKNKFNTFQKLKIAGVESIIKINIKNANKPLLTEGIPKEISENLLLAMLKKLSEKLKVKRLYIASNKILHTKLLDLGMQPVRKKDPKWTVKNEIFVFDHLKKSGDKSFKTKPDLIVIDGGKGQLSSALKAIKKYEIDLNIISIAKKNEEIYLPEKKESISLPKNDPTLLLIQHLRDESHRFAVTFQQNIHLKNVKTSFLDSIEGIGPKTKSKLLNHFGSPESIKQASLKDLEYIVGKKNAIRLKQSS